MSSLSGKETLFYREVIQQAQTREQLPMAGVTSLVSDLEDRLRMDPKVLLALAPLSSRVERTLSHATSVSILNLAQAMALGIEGSLLQEIGIAGMLHDIGKLFIPEEILEKPELDDTERGVYQEHAQRGALYLLDSPWVPKLAVITAFEHHRRFDGTGYPRTGLPLRQNLCSMITAISDAYDALRSVDGTDFPQIGATMAAAAGTAFHPGLTRRFLELMARRSAE
jgi:HD-GYP domain-containing protein (c-di-GMP phosphodiesterase class II)